MKRIYKNKKRLLAALAAGAILTAATGNRIGEEEKPVMAWWGSLYPRFCFSESTEEGKEMQKLRISFRWLPVDFDT